MQLSRLQLQLRQMQSPIRTGAVWRGWDQCRELRRCAEFPIVSIVLSFWEKCFAASRFAPLLAGRLRRLPCTWIKTSAFYMLTVNVFGSFRMQCLMHPLRATLHCRALCHQCATWNQKQNTSQHYSTKRRQAQCNKRTFLTSNHQDSPRHQWHPKHQYQETYTTSGSDRPDRPIGVPTASIFTTWPNDKFIQSSSIWLSLCTAKAVRKPMKVSHQTKINWYDLAALGWNSTNVKEIQKNCTTRSLGKQCSLWAGRKWWNTSTQTPWSNHPADVSLNHLFTHLPAARHSSTLQSKHVTSHESH